MPFRDAHEISGALVRFCEERGLELDEPTDEEYAAVSAHLTPEVRAVLTIEGSVASRSGVGGTAPDRVVEQLATLTERSATWRRSALHPMTRAALAVLAAPAPMSAPALLGATLTGKGVTIRITEVEAYFGPTTPARTDTVG